MAAQTKKSTKQGDFTPTVVHAYRREPYMVPAPNGVGLVEQAVQISAHGEKVDFKSNDKGHVVGTVTTWPLFNRLVNEIPEAYIVYAAGENIPEKGSEKQVDVPVAKFLLTNGTETIVLDDMADDEVREFAATAGLPDEALPDVLTGDTLKTAVFNLLKTGD